MGVDRPLTLVVWSCVRVSTVGFCDGVEVDEFGLLMVLLVITLIVGGRWGKVVIWKLLFAGELFI